MSSTTITALMPATTFTLDKNKNMTAGYLTEPPYPTSYDFDLEEYLMADLFEENKEQSVFDMPSLDGSSNDLPIVFNLPLSSAPSASDIKREYPRDAEDTLESTTNSMGLKRGRPRLKESSSESITDPSLESRREKNRKAAQRCRDRREARVRELEAEVERLKRERDQMMAELVRLSTVRS